MTKLKIVIGSPYNVHRVAYLDHDLQWKGESTLKQFTIGEKLGKGAFAHVHLATYVPTNTKLAVKIFSSHYAVDNINSEISILKECRHPNVVSYFGYVSHNHKLYVMMEYCDAGSLNDLIQRRTEKMKEAHIAYILRCTLQALAYLHGKNIIHRDIKSANILLRKTGKVCVTDFGIAEKIRRREKEEEIKSPTPTAATTTTTTTTATTTTTTTTTTGDAKEESQQHHELEEGKTESTEVKSPSVSVTVLSSPSVPPGCLSPSPADQREEKEKENPVAGDVTSTHPNLPRYEDEPPMMGGTPLWMSPEAIRGEAIDFKSDVWSVGITAIEIAEGVPPHNDAPTFLAVALAVETSASPSLVNNAPSYPNPSPEFINFVDRCLVKDPTERASIQELLEHPFVNVPFLAPTSTFPWSASPTLPTNHPSTTPASTLSMLSSLFSLGRHPSPSSNTLEPSLSATHTSTASPPASPLSARGSEQEGRKKEGKHKRPFLSFLRRSPRPESLSPSPSSPSRSSPSTPPPPLRAESPQTTTDRPHTPPTATTSLSLSSLNSSPPAPPSVLPLTALPEPSVSFVAYINNGCYTQHPTAPTRTSSQSISSSHGGNPAGGIHSPTSSPRHLQLHSPKPQQPPHPPRLLDADSTPSRPPPQSSHRLSLDSVGGSRSPAIGKPPVVPGKRRNSLGSGVGASVLAALASGQHHASNTSSATPSTRPSASNSVVSPVNKRHSLAVAVNDVPQPSSPRGSPREGRSPKPAGSPRVSVSKLETPDNTERKEQPVLSSLPPPRRISHPIASTGSPTTVATIASTLQSPTMVTAKADVMSAIRRKSGYREEDEKNDNQPVSAEPHSPVKQLGEKRGSGNLPTEKRKETGGGGAFMRYLKSKLLLEVHSHKQKGKRGSDKGGKSKEEKEPVDEHDHSVSSILPATEEEVKQPISTVDHTGPADVFLDDHGNHYQHQHKPHRHHHLRHQHQHQHQHHYPQLNEASLMKHTKSAPVSAPPIPKLMPYRGLIVGAEKSLASAFSVYLKDETPSSDKKTYSSTTSSTSQESTLPVLTKKLSKKEQKKLKKEQQQQQEQQQASEEPNNYRRIVDRMVKKSGVSFAPGLDKKRSTPRSSAGSPTPPVPSSGERRVPVPLQRSKRMALLDTTVEEGDEEEDQESIDEVAPKSNSSSSSSARSSTSVAVTAPASAENSISVSLEQDGGEPEIEAQAVAVEESSSPPAAQSGFSFFGKKKPGAGLQLNLSPNETLEDEEATIDVFDGDTATVPSRQNRNRPAGMAPLALGEESDEDEDNAGDNNNNEFNPRESYAISSHGTLNLAHFKINSQGFSSAVVSRQASPLHVGNVGEGEMNGEGIHPLDGADDSASTSKSNSFSSNPEVMEMVLSKDDLVEIGVCGKGQHGPVIKAIHVPTLTRVALKTHTIYDKSTRHQLLHELTAYSKLQSPYLVSFLGAYHDSGSIIMATEFMDQGSLQSFVKNKGKLSERIMCDITSQALLGLRFLHSHHQLHRDVKPDNFLVNSKAEVKIADFGLIRELTDTHAVTDTFLGTMAYLSPERLMSNHYSYAADIWALGLTIIYSLTGSLPRDTTDYWRMVADINNEAAPSLDPNLFSPECCSFVSSCLIMDPEHRSTAEQLLEHEWMKQREDTSDEEIWRAPIDDLDIMLALIIDRHLLPNLVCPTTPNIQHISSLPLDHPLSTSNRSRAASVSAPNSPRGNEATEAEDVQENHETTNNSNHAAGNTTVTSTTTTETTTVNTVTHRENNNTAQLTDKVTETQASSGRQAPQAALPPPSPSPSPAAPSTLTVQMQELRIDVSNPRRLSALPTKSVSSVISPSSAVSPPGADQGSMTINSSSSDDELASPASPIQSPSPPPVLSLELDSERASVLADQFRITEQEVQEHFHALWQAKARKAAEMAAQSPATQSSSSSSQVR